ncbi:MAG: helix-turn-helix domain-containing protein [Flavobacteriales bacterium]|nr:helix-turn-helix domain-containing protein [Flavobacteriales bacterium]
MDLVSEFSFAFNEKSAFLLFFFLIGILFSALTLRLGLRQEVRASKWLSLLLFLCSMYITPYVMGYAGWYSGGISREILFYVPFMQVFLIGPVVYFYTKSLLNEGFTISRKALFHFVPAILYAFYSLVVFITDKIVLDEFYFYADGRDKDLSDWYQAAGLISMSLYLILSLKYYTQYRKQIFNTLSYADTVLFQWIRNFSIAFLVLIFLRVLFFITNPDWGNFGNQFWYYLSFSFVFTYVAIAGYSNVIKRVTLNESGLKPYNVFTPYREKREVIRSQLAENQKSIDAVATLEEPPKAQISDEQLETWKKKLDSAMRNRLLYKNPRLNLADVARELCTNTKMISTVVNRGWDMNFNDYVNQFRIEVVVEKLIRGEHRDKTLLGVALESGFNSKATFNRAFKKITSNSPKEYLNSLSQK